MIKCLRCGHEKDETRYTRGWKTCKFCAWIKKHKFIYPDDWDSNIAESMLEKIFDGQVGILNELEEMTGKTVEEIMKFIMVDLDVHNIGNRKLMVEKKCEICGKPFIIPISKYYMNKFCSRKCYAEYRSKYCIKEKASVYTQIEQECTYCHKKIMLPKNKLESTNSEGKNHHFCSRQCYWNFRSEYYVGERCYNTGTHLSEEYKERCRINTVECYSKGVFNRQTKPQKLVNQMLEELNIVYTNEKNYKYYSLDNHLTEYDLLIEVMGDYFHSNPTKFSYDKLNKMQLKDVSRDMAKRTYIKKYYNIDILYLWESDINNNYDKCKKLIQEYVNNKGNMIDYQSYNYNDDLSLVSQITNPFFIKNP